MNFPLSQLNTLSAATKAFVEKNSEIIELLGQSNNFLSIEKAINAKAQFKQENREILTNELLLQYESIDNVSEKTIAQIELLRQNNTFTICTGQQLHPFLGPALVFYKIIDTIKTAQHFKTLFPDKNFVPLFWMAGEDHDFDEVKTVHLYGKKFEWKTDQKGALGRFKTTELGDLIEEIKNNVNLNEKQYQTLEYFKIVYAQSNNFANATAKIINKLFGEYGLIAIDTDKPSLKNLFKAVIKDDVFKQSNFKAFNNFSEKLKGHKFSLQLSARPINFFYLDNQFRERIEQSSNKFNIINSDKSFTTDELNKEIEQYPEKFSPNAVLRPVYQETILPNVAYIGGNAEINYWLQLKEVFEINQISTPFLKLRFSAWIVNKSIQDWLNKNNLNALDVLEANSDSEIVALFGNNISEFQKYLTEFEVLKTKMVDYAFKEQIPESKNFNEKAKEFEKLINKMDNLWLEVQKIKFDKKLQKIKTIKIITLNTKQIQERLLSNLELLFINNDIIGIMEKRAAFSDNSGIIEDLNN